VKRRRMNPRQRQGLMLVVIAAAGLLGVFLLIADYVSSVSKQVGAKISVVTLVSPLSPYEPVQPNMLGEISVPQKWAPRNAVTDPDQLIGLVSQTPLSAGTELQQGMLAPGPSLAQGQRAMSIIVDAGSGVGLQIQPGDLVDVLAAYQGGGSQGAGLASRNRAEVVVPSARVLTIETPTSGSGGGSGSVPVILSLTPVQAQEVLYAESFAAKLILTKVAPGSAPAALPPYSPSP
jgi:pilus assembly protein CpaB